MYHLVYVYGTLLQGEINHYLLKDATCCGSARTVPAYHLYQLGAYPGAVPGGHTALRGEVYRVNDELFRKLDHLEEHPRLYQRRLIRTPYGRAWIYLYRGERRFRPRISSGDWRQYASTPGTMRTLGIHGRNNSKNRGEHPGARNAAEHEETPLALAA